jgi:hypothetical protein
MGLTVLYHCPCLSPSLVPPPPHLPSSSYSFHPLHTLFFCEECDAVRCNRCVSIEISGYYCPNCLFEVPGASVRAEKNRWVFFERQDVYVSSKIPLEKDARAIVFSVRFAGTHSRLSRLTLPIRAIPPRQLQQLEKRLFCYSATTVDGTHWRLESNSTNPLGSRVSPRANPSPYL